MLPLSECPTSQASSGLSNMLKLVLARGSATCPFACFRRRLQLLASLHWQFSVVLCQSLPIISLAASPLDGMVCNGLGSSPLAFSPLGSFCSA